MGFECQGPLTTTYSTKVLSIAMCRNQHLQHHFLSPVGQEALALICWVLSFMCEWWAMPSGWMSGCAPPSRSENVWKMWGCSMNFDGCFIQNLCLVKKIHLKIFHMGFHTPHVHVYIYIYMWAALHIWVSHMFHASILQLRSWSNLSGAPKPVLPRSGRLSGCGESKMPSSLWSRF